MSLIGSFGKLKEILGAEKGGLGAATSYFWNKTIKQDLWGSVSGKILTVTAALLALKAVWDKLNDEYGLTYKAQMENVEEAREGYSDIPFPS